MKQEKKFQELSEDDLKLVNGGDTISGCENAKDVELCKKFHIDISEVIQNNGHNIDPNLPGVGPVPC